MADFIFNNYKSELMKGSVDLEDDSIKLMLLTGSYTPNVDNDSYYSDISANEISATGYTARGTALSSKTVTVDEANDKAVFDTANIQWTITSSTNIRYAVAYQDTGNDATSLLIQLFDLGQLYTVENATFTFQFDDGGLFEIT